MMKWPFHLLDRLFVLFLAALFVQIPLFIEQYSYRLAGHVSELTTQVDALKTVAAKSGKTLDLYIQKFLESADPDFSRQGQLHLAMRSRLARLSEAHQALREAPPLIRPFTFARYVDLEVAKASLYSFQPGLSFSLESLAFAFAGTIVGMLTTSLLSGLVRRAFTKG